MDRKSIVEKIRKCLALAESSNPHEAAAAMRQAQKMMAAHGIGEDELMAAGVCEEWARSGAARKPPRYEVSLASMVSEAFGCELVFTNRISGMRIVGGYAFIGLDPAAAIAQYAYRVLFRQLRAARAVYIKTSLRRCGPKNKTARADLFCEGWVTAVRRQVEAIAPAPQASEAIAAYMRANYAVTSTLKPTRREPGRHVSDVGDRWRGHRAGQNAVLSQGLHGSSVATPMLG